MRRTVSAAVALLAACSASDIPGNRTERDAGAAGPRLVENTCAGLPAAVDHRAQSLPQGFAPLPGPAILYADPPRAPQLENTGAWQAPPILVSGATAYRCGEFLYQDWLYDDRGAAGTADPRDPFSSSSNLFSPKAGTLTYPTDPLYANNAADLVELRVKPLADATLFRVTLNTLVDAERVAFTLALGTSSAAQDWPHGAGVNSPAEYFLTVHGHTGELLRAADGIAVTPAPSVTVDMERRQIEVRLPTAAWNPGSGVVRLAAGVGLWDAASAAYAQPTANASASAPGGASPSGAALFNLAFRKQEPLPTFTAASGRTIADSAALARVEGHWWRERAQADALADGDISAFFTEVDFAKLNHGENDDSGVPQQGHLNRIVASHFSFGDGINYTTNCGGVSAVRPCQGVLRAQLQPYALYVPEAAPPASGYGFTLQPHALSANYNQYSGSQHAAQFGTRGTGTLVATPSGRGPDGFYFDASQANLFEVWADVARHYPLDADWTVMGGVSMGGIGTFRVATRYPDLFARVHPIVAASGSDAQLPSLRNVPISMWTCAFDELQPVASTEPDISALHALGYRLDSLRFDTWDHLTPSTNDSYGPAAAFLGEARVERHPRRVTYVLAPNEDSADFGLQTQGAYWVSGLTLRDSSLASGQVDVISEGFGLAEPAVLPAVQAQATLTEGNFSPSPYTRRNQDWAAPAAAPVADRLVIKASNIATLTIDPQRARVSCKAAIDVDSDGPLTILLRNCP